MTLSDPLEPLKEWDFAKMKSRSNPYANQLKKQITLRPSLDVVEYFKEMAEETGIPYQSLIKMMQHISLIEKIQTLPEPLLHEVEDFVNFLLSRYTPETLPPDDEYLAVFMTHLAAAGGSFDWLDDPAEDIYSDEDGDAV